jgi:hypothetical protein
MAWRIVGGPAETNDPRSPGGDVVGWTWKIEREGVTREVTVLISRTAYGATGLPSEHLARARDTRGRNYVEAVLDRDDPPRFRTANSAHTFPENLIDEEP